MVFVGMADQFTIEGIVFAVVLAGGGDWYRSIDAHWDAVGGAERM